MSDTGGARRRAARRRPRRVGLHRHWWAACTSGSSAPTPWGGWCTGCPWCCSAIAAGGPPRSSTAARTATCRCRSARCRGRRARVRATTAGASTAAAPASTSRASPGRPREPRRGACASLPARESDGLVWVCPARRAAARRGSPPALPHVDDARLHRRCASRDRSAGSLRPRRERPRRAPHRVPAPGALPGARAAIALRGRCAPGPTGSRPTTWASRGRRPRRHASWPRQGGEVAHVDRFLAAVDRRRSSTASARPPRRHDRLHAGGGRRDGAPRRGDVPLAAAGAAGRAPS